MIEPRLDHLPQELIDQVAADTVVRLDDEEDPFVPDKLADLANLSRTCKRLYVACAPTLLRRVTFQKWDTRLLCFLQSLISKPCLASHVRVFKAGGEIPQGNAAEEGMDKVAEAVLKPDPVAGILLQEHSSRLLWEIVTASTLRLLPDLVALTTSSIVMLLVSWWPENQRLQGSSISVLQVFDRYQPSASLCENMFGWKDAFQPGKTPAALHSLHLHHPYCCQEPSQRGNHNQHQFDLQSRHIAASLRRLELQAWLRYDDISLHEFGCVATLRETLDRCTSLTHLVFIGNDASLKAILGVICDSTVLNNNLQKLEIQMTWATDKLDACTLSQLSRFTHVTSLTLPWLDIDGDIRSETTIWPPSLKSLTVWMLVDFLRLHQPIMINAKHFPTSMQKITFKWLTTKSLKRILNLIDLSRAWDKEFASSGIALVHKYCSPEDPRCSNSMSTSTNIERE